MSKRTVTRLTAGHGSVLRIASSAIGAHKADVPPTKLMGQAGDNSSRFLEITTLKTAYRDTQPHTGFHSYAGACMPRLLCPRFLDKRRRVGFPALEPGISRTDMTGCVIQEGWRSTASSSKI
jgi:hypothetical protein